MSKAIDASKKRDVSIQPHPKSKAGEVAICKPVTKKPEVDAKIVEALITKLETLLKQLNSKLAPTVNNAPQISQLLGGNLEDVLKILLQAFDDKKSVPELSPKQKKELAALEKKLDAMANKFLQQAEDTFKKIGVDVSLMPKSKL
jgi:ABC-type transporter Mla subunit MlaD